MKRFIFLSILFLASSSFFYTKPAEAQYYGYGSSPYSNFYNPTYYTGLYGYGSSYYGCLKGAGCGIGNQVATSINIATDAVSYGINLHDYSKAQEAQIQQNQYQAEAARSAHNYLQNQQDYQNIQAVQPFFEDDIVKKPAQKPANLTPSGPALTVSPKQE